MSGLTHGIDDPASDPEPAGPRRQPGVGQAPQSQQEVELGQVLQGVLVGPLDAVEHLQAGAEWGVGPLLQELKETQREQQTWEK